MLQVYTSFCFEPESDFSLRERLASGGSDKNLLFVANSSSTGIQKSRTGKTCRTVFVLFHFTYQIQPSTIEWKMIKISLHKNWTVCVWVCCHGYWSPDRDHICLVLPFPECSISSLTRGRLSRNSSQEGNCLPLPTENAPSL